MSATDQREPGDRRGRTTIARQPVDELSVLLSPDAPDHLTVSRPALERTAPDTQTAAQAAIERKIFDMAVADTPAGTPRTPLTRIPATAVWHQTFDRSWVLWHPEHGAFALRRDGEIARLYEDCGGPSGYLGWPVSDEGEIRAGALCRFAFTGGAIAWHPRLGTHETRGAIDAHWLDRLGGPSGSWGFPCSGEYDAGNGLRAQDFEGGTLAWRDGIVERPRHPQVAVGTWLTVLDEPRRGATAGPLIRPHGAAALTICRQIESRRAQLPALPEPKTGRRQLTTSVAAAEVAGGEVSDGSSAGAAVAGEQLLQARLDLWHDLWRDEDGPVLLRQTAPGQLSWAGFASDGELQSLLRTMFVRNPDARTLLLALGFSVEELGRRAVFVAADTEHGRRLYADDAEHYIVAQPHLVALLTHIARGSLPRRLLSAAGVDPTRGAALRQALLDAQFLTATAALPAWTLGQRWTRRLRAAVAHNIRAGCVTGWQPFEHTGGDPVEVVRTLAWDFFCGPAALLAQSQARFEGPLGHGALARAACSFPVAGDDDDGHARYIISGGQRRRVEAPAPAP